MTGSLRQSWIYMPADLWEPLAAHASTPPDLFSDLFEAVDDFLAVATPEPQFEEVRNNPTKARITFLGLRGTDFASEFDMVKFLEEVRGVIADYDIAGYEDFYKRLLRDLLRKYNLRYRLDDPFILRFLLPGSFSNLYEDLQRLNAGSQHLLDLWRDYEHSFDRYSRTCQEHDLKVCLANASKYVEGLAGTTCGATGSLGDLCKQLRDWPHGAVRASLSNLHGFCSDYPGIRHAGNPTGQLRSLAKRDSVVISILLIAFTGYLSPQLDEQVILGI